jgi:hypothetical protein
MIDSHFEHIIKTYRKVCMTPDEKREVFQQSMLVIEKIEAVSLTHGNKHAHEYLSTGTETQSEIDGAFSQKPPVLNVWFTYIRKKQFIPALVSAFLLLFTGGTSLLADQALPGESLYSFKVRVNEPIRELTAITTEARAKLAVEVTEKRLQEAAVLSVQGRLDEPNKKLLQDQFTKHAEQIRNRVASLVSRNDLNAAQEVVIDFESALKTHEYILEKLAVTQSAHAMLASGQVAPAGSTQGTSVATGALALDSTITPMSLMAAQPVDPTSDVSGFLTAIKTELDSTMTARIGIEEKVTASLAALPSASSTTPSPIELVESHVRELRFTITDIQAELKSTVYSPATVELVTSRIGSASSSIEQIIRLLNANKIIEAVTLSRDTLKSLSEVETILKIEKNSGDTLVGKLDIGSMITPASSAQPADTATTSTSTSPLDSGTIGR